MYLKLFEPAHNLCAHSEINDSKNRCIMTFDCLFSIDVNKFIVVVPVIILTCKQLYSLVDHILMRPSADAVANSLMK
jgi:hypothetical protein